MSTRKRSNYNRTRKFRNAIYSAHIQAQRDGWLADVLIEERARIRREIAEVSTSTEIAMLDGYLDGMWDMLNPQLEWRLGYASGPADASGVRWDWEGRRDAQPTHGAHFWKGTDKPFDRWAPLNRTEPAAEVSGSMRDVAENTTARAVKG